MQIRKVKLDTELRGKVYPAADSKKVTRLLQAISLDLTPLQATNLARNLLAGAKDWKVIKVTGYRLKKGPDGTCPITVTGYE